MADTNIKKLVFSEEIIKDFEKHALEVIRSNEIKEARYFVYQIWPEIEANKQLADSHPEIYNRLKRILTLNLILLIPSLSEKRVIELFEKGIIWYFRDLINDFDLWEKVRGRIVFLFYDERDIFKEKIRRALLQNNEILTKNKIVRNDKNYPPTIKEWLIDYTSVVGTGKIDAVKMNEYFSSNKNFQQLSVEDKERARQLIGIYERLKRSSLEPEGLEEGVSIKEGDRDIIFTEGRFENYNPKVIELLKKMKEAGLIKEKIEARERIETPVAVKRVIAAPKIKTIKFVEDRKISTGTKKLKESLLKVPSATPQDILTAYQGSPELRQKVAAEEKWLQDRFVNQPKKLREQFFLAVQNQDLPRTIACLRMLVQANDLLKFLAQDEKLTPFLTAVWEKRYNSEITKEFKENPVAPKFVKMFLQYVLAERLGVAADEAARIGMQLSNLFKQLGRPEYDKMAYFDTKERKFRWF